MITIDKRHLDLGPSIGEGGVGIVYRLTKPVAGVGHWPLVYKEVKDQQNLPPGLDRGQVLAQMRKVVAMRDTMSAADLAKLDQVTVWPLAMVEERGADAGSLLRLIGEDFFIQTNPQSGQPKQKVFELQFLTASKGYLDKHGIDRSSADDELVRLALMARLTYALEVVHTHPFVYGDLNPRNVAVATTETGPMGEQPKPQILLMDCDGVAELRDTQRVQLNFLGFVPPEIATRQQKLQDQSTDVFKLGTCITLGLVRTDGRGFTQIVDPAKIPNATALLGPQGIELLRRAVSNDRSRRPTAEELKDYLVERVLSLAQPPELLSAGLNRSVTLPGSDTLVRWDQRHGQQIRIYGVNGFEVKDIDPDGHPNGLAIRPPTAGPIVVEVRNKHGVDELPAGYLDYYELPKFDIEKQLHGALPRLEMPDLPDVEVPEAYARLPDYPVFTTDQSPPPRLELPAIEAYVNFGLITPDASLDAAGPRAALERAHHEVNAGIAAAIGDGIQRMTASVRRRLNDRDPVVAVANEVAADLGHDATDPPPIPRHA